MPSSVTQQVEQAASPKDAMLAIAQALDQLLEREPTLIQHTDPWQMEGWEERTSQERPAAEYIEDEEAGTTDVVIRLVTTEQQERRRVFEQQSLKLSEALGDDSFDWTDAYVKGGPIWLYTANRDLVMSYPRPIREALVQDLIDCGAQQEAVEMGRDILKFPGETGPGGTGMHVAEGDIG